MKSAKFPVAAGILCLALVLVALPFAGGCGPTPQPGQVLKIGMTASTTGQGAAMVTTMAHANLDAIKYVNEELGGVRQYPIEVVWLDNSRSPDKMVDIVNRFMDAGCLMFTTATGGMMKAAVETANRAEFPGLSSFSIPLLYRPPQHIYGQLPDDGDEWTVFAKYYMKNVWKRRGKPKMALHLAKSAAGYGARDAAWAKFEELGIEIVATEEHALTTTTEMESLTRIKAKNPDVLYVSGTRASTPVIVKNAHDLGMYPGIVIASCHIGYTQALVDTAGASVVEGVYGVLCTRNWGDDVPGMAKVVEYCNKLHPEDAGKPEYIMAWAQSLICASALELAVKNAGYPVLAKGNVESWRAMETQGIQKLKKFDVGGLHAPVSYTEGDNRLTKSVRIFQMKNGVMTPISDWVEAPVIKYEEFPWFRK